ncbi:hypothetical protein TMEC54S_00280 [Thauera mechernichensis]
MRTYFAVGYTVHGTAYTNVSSDVGMANRFAQFCIDTGAEGVHLRRFEA